MKAPTSSRSMGGLMTIGDFSRAVRLSAKALRFYHQSGILTPAHIDDQSGYRLYAADQIADAQVIRTLRELDLPVDEVRRVLAAPSVDARAVLLASHLERMETKLAATREAVTSLRSMLEPSTPPIGIVHRSVPEMRVAAVSDEISLDALAGWFRRSIAVLQGIAATVNPASIGRFGGLWPNALFAEERGTATVFLELHRGFGVDALGDGVTILDLPAVELAVAIHDGPDTTVPRVYAALGEYVARHELAIDAPVRETYVTGFPGVDRDFVTEIGWPIFRVSS